MEDERSSKSASFRRSGAPMKHRPSQSVDTKSGETYHGKLYHNQKQSIYTIVPVDWQKSGTPIDETIYSMFLAHGNLLFLQRGRQLLKESLENAKDQNK